MAWMVQNIPSGVWWVRDGYVNAEWPKGKYKPLYCSGMCLTFFFFPRRNNQYGQELPSTSCLKQ